MTTTRNNLGPIFLKIPPRRQGTTSDLILSRRRQRKTKVRIPSQFHHDGNKEQPKTDLGRKSLPATSRNNQGANSLTTAPLSPRMRRWPPPFSRRNRPPRGVPGSWSLAGGGRVRQRPRTRCRKGLRAPMSPPRPGDGTGLGEGVRGVWWRQKEGFRVNAISIGCTGYSPLILPPRICFR